MESLLGVFAVIGIFFLIIAIGIYVAEAIFLNKFNKLVTGKGTALAWIPICNIYLLGKLTVNKTVGWILVICAFLTGTYSTTINGIKTYHSILPEGISLIVSRLYSIAVLGLFVYAIVKYFNLKKNGNVNNQQTQYTQPMNQQYIQQPIQQQSTQQQPNQNNNNNIM